MAPESFDEMWMSDWSEWVLDHGLPELPRTVAIGESVPIAYWAGPAVGAVVHRQWVWGEAGEDDYVIEEVEHFRRTEGGWEISDGGGGGGGWLDGGLEPVAVAARFVTIEGETFTTGDGWSCWSMEGVAGAAVATLRLDDWSGTITRRVDAPTGVFIVASDDVQAALTVLDEAGAVLLRAPFPGAAQTS